MKHNSSNKGKSNNGNKFEKEFTELTGIVKMRKKDKPTFVNSHGLVQVVDFDFATEKNGEKIYVDVTTTFRSDRLKQKSYNALMMKTKVGQPCKFYMVVKTMVEGGKKKNPILIEGIDGVMSIDEFTSYLNDAK
jgi:hypothetical protein